MADVGTTAPAPAPCVRPTVSSVCTADHGDNSYSDHPIPSAGDGPEIRSVHELQESIFRLQTELEFARPNEPLSGRIIQVVHSLPFTFTPLKEFEHRKRKEEAEAATDIVAMMAAAARARRAEREERARLEAAAIENQIAIQNQQLADTKKSRASSFAAEGQRRLSNSAMANMRNPFLDSADLDMHLQENQERARRRAGRRAWMLTELVDDDVDEDDRFSSVSSQQRGTSTSSIEQEMPAWVPRCTGISEQTSPASTPPSERLDRPPWILGMSRGHTALNSGIYSLCPSHKQTYIGAPLHIQFCEHSEMDPRVDTSETTPTEREEIASVLASLENRANWSQHEGNLAMRPPELDSNVLLENGIRYVPVWFDHRAAHSHYEAYCKASTYRSTNNSAMASFPLHDVAG